MISQNIIFCNILYINTEAFENVINVAKNTNTPENMLHILKIVLHLQRVGFKYLKIYFLQLRIH